MKTNRELLELAAKAAGISYESATDAGLYLGGSENNFWQPLTDDGVALRLAVKLNMALTFSIDGTMHAEGVNSEYAWENMADPMQATRRAIVRAAAQIGKAMP